MTIPSERKNAVLYAAEFLLDLCIPSKTPRVPKSIRKRARQILRHYPSDFDLKQAARGVPGIFADELDASVETRRRATLQGHLPVSKLE